MAFSRADVLAAAQLSLQRAAAHDRAGWLDLFAVDARVEDPVGARAHRGRRQLDAFYRTFIAPRDITAHVNRDLVVDTVVLRDVTLEVAMSPSVTMFIPAYLRYDLAAADLKISRLQAFWELPTMVGQFLGSGVGAVPAGVRLSGALLRNQGFGGAAGFLQGFRGAGRRGRRSVVRFLSDAAAGDEVAVRRRLPGSAPILDGAGTRMTQAALLSRLAGGTADKLIAAGDHVVARVDRGGRWAVLVATLGAGHHTITGLRYYAEDDAVGD